MKRRQYFLSSIFLACLIAPIAGAADDAGLREIKSRHLLLITDLPPDDEVDALGDYFDQAFDQWCAYFGVDAEDHADWQVRGCLIRTSERFRSAGLLPDNLPPFANAYSIGDRLWMYEQTSVYYRRHLLLHEGTHCFMHAILGGIGPPWFAEGMAELLGTHRVDDGKLVLNDFPRSRDDVSKWGRIEIVQTAFAERRANTLEQTFALGGTLHAEVDAYGWCWAAAAFFDGHPRYRDRFRELRLQVAEADFRRRVNDAFAADAARLNEDWQLFVANIDYGYDFGRMDFDPAAGKSLASKSAIARVAADRGWQSTGIALEAGGTYRLHASGQYVIADDQQPWVSEPGGVTIEYVHGQPLGILLAAIRSDRPAREGPGGLVQPIVVGLDATLKVRDGGTLFLRVNDSAGRLDDNSGNVRVEISRE